MAFKKTFLGYMRKHLNVTFLAVAVLGVIVLACGTVIIKNAAEPITGQAAVEDYIVLASEQVSAGTEIEGTLRQRGEALVGVLEITEDQSKEISIGEQASVSCLDLQLEKITGIVSDIQNVQAVSTTGAVLGQADSYEVTITLCQLSDQAKDGMSIAVTFNADEEESHFAVPEAAIGDDDHIGSYVLAVYEDGETKQIQVTRGELTSDGNRIINGLHLAEGLVIRADLTEE